MIRTIVMIDNAVQRGVNAGMFLLMRAGFTKAGIRYTLFAIVLVSMLGAEVARIVVRTGGAFYYLWVFMSVWVILHLQNRERRADEREARDGLPVRRTDAYLSRPLIWAMLGWNIAVLNEFAGRPDYFVGQDGPWQCFKVFNLVSCFSWLLVAYSATTPPQPPARVRDLVHSEAH